MFGSRPIEFAGDRVSMSSHLMSLSPGAPLMKSHRVVLGFVFAESPGPAPHTDLVTALEKEGQMQ
jgi:hypothetical protein